MNETLALLLAMSGTLVGLLPVLVAGLPLTQVLIDRQLHRSHGNTSAPRGDRAPASLRPGFTPLDFGPDPMLWPSQRADERPARPELSWPSSTWDDPHFGRHAAAPPKAPEGPARPRSEKPKEEKRKGGGKSSGGSKGERKAKPADGLPSVEELESLIAENGITTVAAMLMQQNGWTVEQVARWIREQRQR